MPLTRTSRLSVRASPEELVCWTHLARSHGHATTSDWIRCLLTSAELAGQDGRSIPEELRELRHQLSRVGNNLNQLARSANCGDAIQCGNVLDDIEPLITRLDQLLSPSRKKRSLRSAHRKCERAVVTRH